MSLFDSQAVSFHNKLEVFQVDPRVVVVTSTHKIVGAALRAPLMDVLKGVLRGGQGWAPPKTRKIWCQNCQIKHQRLHYYAGPTDTWRFMIGLF
ncbi:unnamed protein product [Brassica rapa]|uniref:Uncharacterized protein n=1 Tax=Brassica campestris TaxID=3711 RepID=A0A8D9GWW2_BRACM|nr:unnamed protein product [Brassica rapa]